MIAAQALVHRAILVTFNADDFSEHPPSLVPGLALEVAAEGLGSNRTSKVPQITVITRRLVGPRSTC
jgi:hypothetical protein